MANEIEKELLDPPHVIRAARAADAKARKQDPSSVLDDLPDEVPLTATITIAPAKVEHIDAEAAGWTNGYWWTVEDGLGKFESGAETEDAARAQALEVARSHGYPDDLIDMQDEER